MSLTLETLALLRGIRKNILVDTGEGVRGVSAITIAGCEGKGYLFVLEEPDSDEGRDNGKETRHRDACKDRG